MGWNYTGEPLNCQRICGPPDSHNEPVMGFPMRFAAFSCLILPPAFIPVVLVAGTSAPLSGPALLACRLEGNSAVSTVE